MTYTDTFEKMVLINAPAVNVWQYLTTPLLMVSWMGDPDMQIAVQTNWEIGQPIIITGVHHLPFENKGTVLLFQPPQVLQFTHLSSLSRLPDLPENYTTITFQLQPEGHQTLLIARIHHFPTETIYHHFQFYWQGALGVLKQAVEGSYIR